jgi:hypothetical protein
MSSSFPSGSLAPWLSEALPADVKVLIVADRGFGDQKLYQVLTDDLKFDSTAPSAWISSPTSREWMKP